MTDEQQIGQAGNEDYIVNQTSAESEGVAGDTANGPIGGERENGDEAWLNEKRNEEASTHGSP